MRKFKCSILILLLILSLNVNAMAKNIETHSDAYMGSGTLEDPYLIYSEFDLIKVGKEENWSLDKCYKLMDDIVIEKTIGAMPIREWVPIGTSKEAPFTGIFDGNGKTISGLSYVLNKPDICGLFGYISGENCRIENLGVIDVDMFGNNINSFVGALVGVNDSATIINCYAQGYLSGSLVMGGLVGNNSGIIENCYANVNIRSYLWNTCMVRSMKKDLIYTKYPEIYTFDAHIGGLVGVNTDGKILKSYSKARYLIGDNVGGIVGYLVGGIVQDCYSLSNVEGWINTGGIVGFMRKSSIENCYYAGNFIKGTINSYGFNNGILGLCHTRSDGKETSYSPNFVINSVSLVNEVQLSLSDGDLPSAMGEATFYNNLRYKDTYFTYDKKEITIVHVDNEGFTTKAKDELLQQKTYENLGWNFSEDNPIWEFSGEYSLPKLVGVKGQENLTTPTHLL